MGVFMESFERKSYVLEQATGKRWRFNLNPQMQITYSYVKDGVWTTPDTIDRQKVNSFTVTVDSNDKIHILAHTASRQLIYFESAENGWKGSILEKIVSRFHNISYFDVFSTHKLIHILYYISNTLRKGTESMIHFTGDGNKWEGGKVFNFLSDDSISIFSGFVDSVDALHILHSGRVNKERRLYIRRFDPFSMSWTQSEHIHQNPHRYKECYLYIESGSSGLSIYHIVWKEEQKQEDSPSSYAIMYMRREENSPSETGNNAAVKLYEGDAEPKYPVITIAKNMQCQWFMNDTIYMSESPDNGNTWLSPQMFSQTRNEKAALFRFISLVHGNRPITKETWGSEASMLSIPVNKALVETLQAPSADHNRITRLEERIEELVATINAVQERMNVNSEHQQSEKMVKRLLAEFEHMRQRQARSYKGKTTTQRRNPMSSEQVKSEPTDSKGEKFALGKIDILINPEEEEQ